MNDLEIDGARVLLGDCIARMKGLPDKSVQMCVTSPPYFGLRDYGHDGQLGLEPTPEQYVANMVSVFSEVKRLLADDGTLWLNIGDSYSVKSTYNAAQSLHTENDWKQSGESKNTACYERTCGVPAKNLLGIPWRLAFALQADGWYLRQDIIWHKPNPMPESVRDRCTKAHEYMFLLSKSERYFFDSEAMREPCSEDMQRRAAKGHTRGAGGKIDASRQDADTLRGEHAKVIDVSNGRNRRSVWTVATRPYKGAHFATFPPALVEPCILAGSHPGDVVLDPFNGSGTTGQVALQHDRRYIGIELNQEYVLLTRARLEGVIKAKAAAATPSSQSDLFAAA